MIQAALAAGCSTGTTSPARRRASVMGHDHGGRGDAGPDRRLPGRAAREGRDGRRDRRLRRGHARARARGAAARATTSSTRAAPAATAADTFNISTAAALVAAAAGAGGREARQPRGLVGLGLRRRARGARLRARAAAGADRAVDRRARLRLPLRADPPPGDAPRGAGAPRARRRDRVQPARPAHQPGRRARQIVGVYAPELVRTIADVLARLGARRAFVVHGAGGIDELSPPGRTSSARSSTATVREREIDPLELGVARCDPAELRGGSTRRENARGAHPRGLFGGAADAAARSPRRAILLERGRRDRRGQAHADS